jgi:hypothetical protein
MRFKLFYYLVTESPRVTPREVSTLYVNANNMDHAQLLGHSLVSRLTLEEKREIFLGRIEGGPDVRLFPNLKSLEI